MAKVEVCTCSQCEENIDQGAGRMTRLLLRPEVIPQIVNSTPKHDAGVVIPDQHFCDINCLAAWSVEAAERWKTDEEAHVAAVAAANKKD